VNSKEPKAEAYVRGWTVLGQCRSNCRGKRDTHILLAGVCGRLAHLFRCNVWVLRAGFILLLLLKTFLTLVVYGVLALLFRTADYHRGPDRSTRKDYSPGSPRFAAHNRRIKELDRRFREWEDSLGR
jgi:phage shock protein PspC (stress-responsive transcriptional regulator)